MPTFTMPAFCASAMTVASSWNCVVRSTCRCSSGWGLRCASFDRRFRSESRSISTSFRYIVPSASSAITIVSGFSSSSTVDACGRSILILWAINGAVIMKMINSTSMTSTSGIMLISAIGELFD